MNTIKKHHKRRSQGGNHKQRSGRRQAAASLDYNQLIKKQSEVKQIDEFVSNYTYEELMLHPALKKSLSNKGYERPTEIQEKSLEHLLNGENMVAVAKTGTGKTAAFLIPVIENLLTLERPFQTLVVVPTRELAQQVEMEFRDLTRGMGLYTTCLIGGTSVRRDLDKLKKRNHMIVGTPGRLMDMYRQGALKLANISVLVLDEFDRMLDMGFVKEIQQMVGAMRQRSQTMLFSATLDKSQKEIIREIVPEAVQLRISSGQSAGDNIEQHVIKVTETEDKFSLLLELLESPGFEKVIVFAETKRLVDRLNKKLDKNGVTSVIIHGDKSQNYRSRAIRNFKDGRSKVLIATDVAARGIDIDDVSHVINYQIPLTMESYLHRIGRTGRAGKKGTAYTFVG